MTGVMGLMASQGGRTVVIGDQDLLHTAIDPADASVDYVLTETGLARSNGVTLHGWLTPVVSPGDFEVRATVNSGAFTTGTVGAWEALSAARTWTRTRTAIGTSAVNATFEIRRASDGVVLDSATIILTATVE
jgi:hypothetical protein